MTDAAIASAKADIEMLGVLETGSPKPNRELKTPHGPISNIPPELALETGGVGWIREMR